jgi:hypothetical protein
MKYTVFQWNISLQYVYLNKKYILIKYKMGTKRQYQSLALLYKKKNKISIFVRTEKPNSGE